MRAFKKLMAGAIATAIAATMATSAFAAELKNGKMVLSEGETYTAAGQTTVLVVPYDVWVNDALVGLEDADIFYIDQWETAKDANDAIAAGLGVKLENNELADINETKGAADYYVLFGENGNITALECVIGAAEPALALGDADSSGTVNESDAVRILDYCIELATLSDAELVAADVDKGGAVNESDAVDILDYCIELPSYTGGTK